ncbi:MAG: glutathione S-transferase family protein [Oceanospirillaceae bacterium]
MYQLYYYPGNASIAPHMMLEALGVPYELVLVDRSSNAQKSPQYLKLNPTGRIPTLIDTSITHQESPLVVFESTAICLHLLDQHPQSSLIPEIGNPLRSQFHQWLMYLNNTVQAELMLYFYPEKYTSDQHSVDAIQKMAEARVTQMFILLDQQLHKNTFLVGDQLSVCDFFLVMVANWASEFAQAPLSLPNLGRYLKMMAQQACVIDTFKGEGRNLDIYQ